MFFSQRVGAQKIFDRNAFKNREGKVSCTVYLWLSVLPVHIYTGILPCCAVSALHKNWSPVNKCHAYGCVSL